MDLYSEIILDHYQNPHNFGILKKPSILVEDANASCGDSVKLSLKIGKDSKIKKIGFSGVGCAISMASTSMLTDLILGKSLDDIQKLKKEDIFEMLNVTISPSRVKCALLGLATAKKAAVNYKVK